MTGCLIDNNKWIAFRSFSLSVVRISCFSLFYVFYVNSTSLVFGLFVRPNKYRKSQFWKLKYTTMTWIVWHFIDEVIETILSKLTNKKRKKKISPRSNTLPFILFISQQVRGADKSQKHGATEGCAINHRKSKQSLLCLHLWHKVEFLIIGNQILLSFFLILYMHTTNQDPVQPQNFTTTHLLFLPLIQNTRTLIPQTILVWTYYINYT